MKEYYSKRAKEYEQIYHRDDPVRQGEQQMIGIDLARVFKGRNVLEVACGTGYWTEEIVKVAASVTATDISEETLEIARSKQLDKVTFEIGDAYLLEKVKGDFNAGCANFWFSHIPKRRINEFIEQLHKKLGKGSAVFMADNVYIEGIGGKLVSKEGEQDTYKVRKLSDGSTYEIIKNYYDKDELTEIFNGKAENLNIHIGKCFWWLDYIVK